MDQVLNKVGSYWFSKRASKEIDSIGDDISVILLEEPGFWIWAVVVGASRSSLSNLRCDGWAW
nr:unnamed protein product [Digitaria exilis]